jgi:hypothetical protein
MEIISSNSKKNNAMAKGKATKRQTIVDKIKIEQVAPVLLLVILGNGHQVIVGGSYT